MIRIVPSGVVEYARKDENGTWRTTIVPGDYDEAAKHLSADELKQAQEVWTPELVQKWIDEHPVPLPSTEPRHPRPEERIATLEALVAELTVRVSQLESVPKAPIGTPAGTKGK